MKPNDFPVLRQKLAGLKNALVVQEKAKKMLVDAGMKPAPTLVEQEKKTRAEAKRILDDFKRSVSVLKDVE